MKKQLMLGLVLMSAFGMSLLNARTACARARTGTTFTQNQCNTLAQKDTGNLKAIGNLNKKSLFNKAATSCCFYVPMRRSR